MLLAVGVILAIILIYLVGVRRKYSVENTQEVASRLDGLKYRVHKSHSDPQLAADVLAFINARIIKLMRCLRDDYARGESGLTHPQRRKAVLNILARYNPDNLTENSPNDPKGDTSYTLDKGAVIALCLRERDPTESGDPGVQDIHDVETLTFVALHELAHIAIEEVDHPPRFWSAFRFILEEAEKNNIYFSPRFGDKPRLYCGMQVDYNPRFDPGTKSL